MSEIVRAGSLVTLRYSVNCESPTGTEVLVSTFDSRPATLLLGNGELAEPFEACIIGMEVGARRVFELKPEQAFGATNPQLVQRMPRDRVPGSIKPAPVLGRKDTDSQALERNGMIEFATPGGQAFAGVVREIDGETVLVDFNHPLAGKTLRFEVEIIGVI